MAVMSVNTTSGNEEQLGNRMLRGFRARVDAFASSRMLHAVAEAERVRGFGRRPSESSLARASDHTEAPGVELKPLGEDIISAAIPAFFIGRNKAGQWVAREAKGRTGGIFLLKRSALAFARAKIESAQCALFSRQRRSSSTSKTKAIRSHGISNRCRASAVKSPGAR